MAALTFLGSGWTMLALAPMLAAQRMRVFAVWLLGVLLLTSGLVSLVKPIVRRTRPCAALEGVRALWGEAPTDYSFPSGHAAGAFACAAFVTVICLAERRHEPWRWTLAACLFALAIGVAVSRVSLGVHFPSDVAGGAVIGALLGVAGGRAYLSARRRASRLPQE